MAGRSDVNFQLDVLFANIRISEHNTPTPDFAPNYGQLFDVGGTNAWLVGCDSTSKSVDPVNPKQKLLGFRGFEGWKRDEVLFGADGGMVARPVRRL